MNRFRETMKSCLEGQSMTSSSSKRSEKKSQKQYLFNRYNLIQKTSTVYHFEAKNTKLKKELRYVLNNYHIAQPNFLYVNNSLVKNKLHSEERNRNIMIWSYVKQTFFLYIQMLSMCLENNNLSKCPHQLVSVSHSKPRFCQCLYFYGFKDIL